MATLERAIEIAARAHAGQLDKSGQPYILHPLRVMLGVQSDEARIIAVLHDVIEDTSVTEADLRREGFSESIIAGVLAVTKREGEPYVEFVLRSSRHEAARQVKLADITDNSSLQRALMRPGQVAGDARRMRKYLLSYRFLQGQLSEADYRAA